MKKILLDIKIKYNTFSNAEKKIADYLLNPQRDDLPMFITELATRCGTSEATIVRFSKRLGFNGYQQFKLALARSSLSPVGTNITKEDSAYDILEKVCSDVYCSLEKTKSAIDKNALQRCCEKILSAEQIYIFGLGNSASVAMDASHKMFRLGLHSTAYTDNHMQSIAASHTTANDVVIGISHSGRSKDVIQALKIAKDNGAATISLTNQGKSPIEKVSDIVLHTVSDETNYRILGLSSRIAQLAIIDTLYSYLVCHIDNAQEEILKTESSLQMKKL